MAWFKRRKDLGFRLLGVWLIAWGASSILNFNIPFSGPLVALLGIATGVLILFDR